MFDLILGLILLAIYLIRELIKIALFILTMIILFELGAALTT